MNKSLNTASHALSRLRRIEGRHNLLVKQLRQAFSRAELTDSGECAIEGLRILEEAIRRGMALRTVFFRESAHALADRLLPQIGSHVETLLLPDKLFDSAVPSESPQGVAALVRLKSFTLNDVMERLQLGVVVVLAGLQDPGNLGTIVRSAEAFGSAGIIIGEGTVSPFNAKAVRASAGSIFGFPMVQAHEAKNPGSAKPGPAKSSPAKSLPTSVRDAVQKLRENKVRLIATSAHKGTPLDQADLKTPCAILFGNEGAGLSRELMGATDETIAIPHHQQVESLNAGVAASIVLYEAARQRKNALSS
jgi:TrmH family RNA methyltransferase